MNYWALLHVKSIDFARLLSGIQEGNKLLTHVWLTCLIFARYAEARALIDREEINEVIIIDKPITFDKERIRLTIDYRRMHQDPASNDVIIKPLMIIIHSTGTRSFESTWRYFNKNRIERARASLLEAGAVNVSAHFLVDRDGTIYRLMPENWMARHCIGLNHVAIGIENIGDEAQFCLTQAQVKANVQLIDYLSKKYPITHLIGHMEYLSLVGHPYFLERSKCYRTKKNDPGNRFMCAIRERVVNLKLQGALQQG